MRKLLSWRGHVWLGLAARLYLGAVFVFAAWHKLLDPGAFALDVATYQFLPLWAINGFALTLPWIEIGAGGMAILGLRARAAALVMAGMMTAFIVALIHALANDLNLSCGCFASASAQTDPIGGWTLMRDLAWLALAMYIVVCDRRPLGLERLFVRNAATK